MPDVPDIAIPGTKGVTIDSNTGDIKGISPVTALSRNQCTNSVRAEISKSEETGPRRRD